MTQDNLALRNRQIDVMQHFQIAITMRTARFTLRSMITASAQFMFDGKLLSTN